MNSAGIHLLFGLGLLLVGAGTLVGIGRTLLRRGRIRAGWATTPGQITRSGIREHWNAPFGSPTRTFSNDLAYTYTVDGRPFTGTRLSPFTLQTNLRGRAERVAARYPVGQAVRVHYDPRDPADALLDPGGGLGVGVLGVAVMALVTLAGWAIVRGALAGLGG